jgi:hypothetical protein
LGDRLSNQLRRGDVVRLADHVLIVWEIDSAGMPLGIPVRPQTGPRHRSHVPIPPFQAGVLGLKPRASVIQTEDVMVYLDDMPQLLGHADDALVADIARTIMRARHAAAFEKAMTQCR